MKSVEAMIGEVRRAPEGPVTGAFFDVDGTILAGYSAAAFYRHRARALDIGPGEALRTLLLSLRRGDITPERFSEFMALALSAWRGRSETELDELGERLFREELAASLYPEAWALVQAHRRQGHTVVLASSAVRFQIAPLARELEVEHFLSTEVETRDGVLTGEVDGQPLWGEEKARAVRELAAAHGVELAGSFAYSNGYEDLPLLRSVGRPRPLNAEPRLAAEAARRGWPVRSFGSRGRPGVSTVARTAAAYGGLIGGFGVGAGLGLLNRSRQRAAELALTLGSELSLALAGIDTDVQHEERLWSHRPAVFIINHQSPLDVPVMCKLLRGSFSGVAKKEAIFSPAGPVMWLADVAFLDRGDPERAKAALRPAVQRLRDGVSVAIAPEGTRSVTPRLGQFKKGAFHLAIEAEVPIVPVVLRNVGEAMWRNAKTMRPATVEVHVHEPVDVRGWDPRNLNGDVEDVRRLYLETLERWPSRGANVGVA
jgi:putative phosphoserine phosphatase/1-acylglycerol-3-phosphate O-acyltransferase